jgi:hypothetical protein
VGVSGNTASSFFSSSPLFVNFVPHRILQPCAYPWPSSGLSLALYTEQWLVTIQANPAPDLGKSQEQTFCTAITTISPPPPLQPIPLDVRRTAALLISCQTPILLTCRHILNPTSPIIVVHIRPIGLLTAAPLLGRTLTNLYYPTRILV